MELSVGSTHRAQTDTLPPKTTIEPVPMQNIPYHILVANGLVADADIGGAPHSVDEHYERKFTSGNLCLEHISIVSFFLFLRKIMRKRGSNQTKHTLNRVNFQVFR